MTDHKALIAEAREAKIILSVRLPDEEMMQIARLLDLNARLAAALEEAAVPDGWRVTEFEREDRARAVRRRDGSWHALDRNDFRVSRDENYIHPTAREAMAALDAQKAPPPD